MKRKRKLKKLLAILLTIVMSMSMINLSAFASIETPDGGDNDPVITGTDEAGGGGQTYTCGLEEHTHTDACYAMADTLQCNMDGVEGHEHSDRCYLALSCGKEAHTHSPACIAADDGSVGDPDEESDQEEREATLENWERYGELEDSLQHLSDEISRVSATFVDTYEGTPEDFNAALAEELNAQLGGELSNLIALYDSIPEPMKADSAYADVTGALDGFKAAMGIKDDNDGETSGDAEIEAVTLGEEEGTLTWSDGVGNNGSNFNGKGTITVNGNYKGTITVKAGNITINGNGTIDATGKNTSAITVENGTVTLDGDVTVSGGIGTEITSSGMEPRGDYTFRVGGGVYVQKGTFKLLNGIISNNNAQRGGGIFVNQYGNFEMTGGVVSNNHTIDKNPGDKFAGEGGGIFVWGNATIKGGEIINNTCGSQTDLGGGGLYVNNGGVANLINAKITKNTADGWGGGIAGCCHGETSLVATDGVALYGNTAYGTSHTLVDGEKGSDGVAEIVDHFEQSTGEGITAANSMDFYTAGACIVSNYMTGGGSARYKAKFGSAEQRDILDNEVIGITADVGLVGDPTEESIAKITPGVTISGNHSTVHGGGIGCNGALYFGSSENSEFNKNILNLKLNANKKVDGSRPGSKVYNFELLYSDGETVAAKAKNNPDGTINFELNYVDEKFISEGNNTFYVQEAVDNENNQIIFDKSIYEVTVNLHKETKHDKAELTHNTGSNKHDVKVTYTTNTYTPVGEPTIKRIRDVDGNSVNPSEEDAIVFNNKTKGNLTVSKTVVGNKREEGREWHFTVTLSDKTINGTYGGMDFTNGEAQVTLKHGESATAEGLPSGIGYTVTEKEANSDHYATGIENGNGTIPNDNGEVTAKFTNVRGDQEKIETDPGDEEKVEVGDVLTYKINWINNTDHTANVIITDPLDPGVEFVSAPADKDGVEGVYDESTRTVTWTKKNQPCGAEGTVELKVRVTANALEKGEVDNQAVVKIDNYPEQRTDKPSNIVKTGNLAVEKYVNGFDGAEGQEVNRYWHFTVTLMDKNGNILADFTRTCGEMEFKNGVAEFALKHGERKTASNLPTGIQYKVSEKEANDNGYNTSAVDANGKIVYGDVDGEITYGGVPVVTFRNDSQPTSHKTEVTPGKGKAVKIGDEVTYEIEWVNFTNTVQDVYIYDILDECVDLVSVSDGGEVVEIKDNTNPFKTLRRVEWHLGDQAVGASGKVTLTVKVNEKLKDKPGFTIHNQAEVHNGDAFQLTEIPDNPMEEGNLTVTKTVTGRGDKEKEFTFTVELSDKTLNGTYGDMTFTNGEATFTLKHGESKTAKKLPAGITYKVTEAEANQDGYTTTSTGEEGTITAEKPANADFVNHIPEPYVGPSTTSVSVNKVWVGDEEANVRPDSIQVQLYKNGAPYESPVTLSAPSWSYTWRGLEIGASYNVVELNVPTGYDSLVDQNGQSFTITNTWNPVPLSTQLSVDKVWVGDNANVRPTSIQVQLYKDGQPEGSPVTLSASDDWSYNWSDLDVTADYTVRELNVPDGYTSSVTEDGMSFTITNTYSEEEIPEPDVPLADKPDQPSKTVVTTIPNPNVPLASMPGEESNTTTIEDTAVPLGDAPKTGDESPLALWTILMLGSLLGVVGIRRYLTAKRAK